MKSLYDCFFSSPFCSNKYTSYFPAYEALLSDLRSIPITLLEIGIQDGGSLYMWKEYLHPESKIVGCDLNPDIVRFEEDGFGIIVGDQSNPSVWQTALSKHGPFDVIIDDGSHLYKDQIKSVLFAINCLKSKGLLIVEDTHTSFLQHYGGPTNYSFVNWTYFLANMLNFRSPTLLGNKPLTLPIISITYFESIIAFKIDKSLAISPCHLISNNKAKSLNAKDYTFEMGIFSAAKLPGLLNIISSLIFNLLTFYPSLRIKIQSKINNIAIRRYFNSSQL